MFTYYTYQMVNTNNTLSKFQNPVDLVRVLHSFTSTDLSHCVKKPRTNSLLINTKTSTEGSAASYATYN